MQSYIFILPFIYPKHVIKYGLCICFPAFYSNYKNCSGILPEKKKHYKPYNYIYYFCTCTMFVCINSRVYFSFTSDLGWQWGRDFRMGFYGQMEWEVSCLRCWDMSVPQGQSHEVTVPSAIPSLFSLLDECLNAVALPALIHFCCRVAASTGSCTPREPELVLVLLVGDNIPSRSGSIHPAQRHQELALYPPQDVLCYCACLSSPYILDVENGTNFILNKSHLRFSIFLSSYTEPLVFSIFFF